MDKQRLKRGSYEFKILGDAYSLPFKRENFRCRCRNDLSTVHRRLERCIKGNVKGLAEECTWLNLFGGRGDNVGFTCSNYILKF